MATEREVAQNLLDIMPDDEWNSDGEQGDEEVAGTAASGDKVREAPAGEDDGDDFDEIAAEALRDEFGGGDEEELEEDGEPETPEDDEDDEEEPETPPSDDELITVKVDGEEIQVTEEELRAGYSRTASWTRKAQELAEERRAFEAEQEAVRAERAQYGAALQTLEQQLQAKMPQRPTGDDPRKWAEYQRAKAEFDEVQAERQRLHQKMAEDMTSEREKIVRRENEALQQAIPEWQDEEKMSAGKTRVIEFAKQLGFSDEELGQVADHRVVVLLKKAADAEKYEAAAKRVREKAKTAPTLKPGSRKSSKATKRAKARKQTRSQRDRLRKTGKERDAAAFIETMLD